ncbi:N-acetylmuramoyl-L-alanine amidase [Geomicrobium sp. JSM 1781026]|uniref:N-acetylmuramoyl-L-alanine amidase family protein n=1 Tax=Geomicrobium sp. JSM 1781026 TaxID=3344580 RepID=UPI0035C0A8E4
MTKIFIDPGHGGHDPGAQGNGLTEKVLVLQIGLRVRDILLSEYENVDVAMSRTTDVFVELSERANRAVRFGADGFVSIHLNAYVASANGTETFMHNNSNLPSLRNQLHRNILSEIRRYGTVTDRGLKSANFAVLRGTYQSMKTALTESLFITNARDAALLKRSEVIEAIARGHVNGIAAEFNLSKITAKEEEQFVNLNDALFASNIEAIRRLVRRHGVGDMSQRLENGTLPYEDLIGTLIKAMDAPAPTSVAPAHQEAWQKATSQGILNGERPKEPVSREQLATVLDRTGNLD